MSKYARKRGDGCSFEESGSYRWRRCLGRGTLVLAVALSLFLGGIQDAWAIIQPINLGDQVAGVLNADQDVFPCYALEGTKLKVSVKSQIPLVVDVSVYGPDGLAVAGLATKVGSRGVAIAGVFPATGNHTIVVAAANGTAGTYTMKTAGKTPSTIKGGGYVSAGGDQTIEFSAFAGSQLKNIKIKRTVDTLTLSANGVLTDPDDAVVVLDDQTADGKKLTASGAALGGTGIYAFTFTPTGTGGYTYTVKLKVPKVAKVLHVLPTVRPAEPPIAGTGVSVRLSAPANETHFLPGEAPWVTVVLNDDAGNPLTLGELSTANLYLYGPQAQNVTTTAVALLRASTDRNARPHHYIDLRTNPDVTRYGNVVTYPLSAVTTELPGTYTATVWAVLSSDSLQQWMGLGDFQIGTATPETQIVERENCAKCHLGAASGKYYLHHIDVNLSRTPPSLGSPALDSWPVRTCKSCHNQDGYAAYRDPKTGDRVPDPIVKRVMGVHNGEELRSPENVGNWLTLTDVVGTFAVDDTVTGGTSGATAEIDLVIANGSYVIVVGDIEGDFVTGETLSNGGGATGTLSVLRNAVFGDYKHVVFPAGVRDCSYCHVDDRWKTNPSRQACGACHDDIWFGDPLATPDGYDNHPGGQQPTDANCLLCHGEGAPEDIAVMHDVGTPPLNTVDVSLTPPPANGTYYVAGEAPVVTVVINGDNGDPISDHTNVTDVNFSTAGLFVYGPRSLTMPVLTSTAANGISKARASVTSSKAGPWAELNGKTFKISVNGSAPLLIPFVGSEPLTVAEAVASLNAVVTSYDAKAAASGSNVNLRSDLQGSDSRFEIHDGDITTAMGWKRGPNTVMEPDITIGQLSYPINDLRALADPLDYSDPRVTRNVGNITYPLDDVAGLTPGTYFAYVWQTPRAGKIAGLSKVGIGIVKFQAGTATEEKKVATNCSDCHSNTIWHLYEGPQHPAPFDTDYCKACHDYSHYSIGDLFKNQGGTSLSGWSGFGAMPIVRRVHGVHRGHYLEHPEEIYANATQETFGEIIFPQDIRNCTKCHAETNTWTEKPSRVACLACHDTDAAKAHGKIMTYDPTPEDPYGGDEWESCTVCHGEDADLAPSVAHNIWDPYVWPYPREPE